LAPLVLKIGGELLEDPSRLEDVVAAVAKIASSGVGLVVAHGGGREIDAALKAAGIEKRQVEGLRITDERTLGVVVAVLVGTVNTRLVAALTAAEVAAVGLTGVDGGCGLAEAAPPHRTVDGRSVDLGRVGVPSEQADMRLLTTLLRNGFVPVVASIGVGRDGRLLNVNADTFAGHLAARLGARRLDVFEKMDLAFHRRVRQGYLEIAREEKRRMVVLDAAQPAERVHQEMKKAAAELLRQRGLARGV